MNTPCEKSEVINIIRDDLKEVKSDTKEILKFKNQALAIIVSISTVIPLAVTLLISFIKK